MAYDQTIVHALYKKLITLYPRLFRERLGESMEQTFQDLWNEKRQLREGMFGFVVWTFIETILGIARERFMLIGKGDIMQTILKTTGLSMLMSFLIILPFMIMEVVNRRHLNEDFPTMLFFVMGLNLFAISLILLPIVRSRRGASRDTVDPVSTPGNMLLTNPWSAAIISVALILFPFILSWLDSLSWVPLDLDRLFNGPNPEVPYPPGQILALAFFAISVAGGIIAGGPIVRTLRGGGSLFAHPIHLIIVALIVSTMAFGLGSLIIDQWPCFMGVPNCD
jgi:hypothetical protein